MSLTIVLLPTNRHGWRRGVVVSVVRRMNEVNARRARLVPVWLTVFVYRDRQTDTIPLHRRSPLVADRVNNIVNLLMSNQLVDRLRDLSQ